MSLNKISVIGLGAIGSRHLQALTQNLSSYELYCIDPSQASIELSKSRLSTLSSSHKKRVTFHTSIDSLPDRLDLAIIATSSDVRLNVLEKISQTSSVKNLILEKVLFQRVNHLTDAQEILDEKGIEAWVNCPRRLWPIYKEVKKLLLGKRDIKFLLSGKSWGLACNSIHYLDIFGWISNSMLESIDISGLDHKLLKSKREGFLEFSGTMNAHFTNRNKMSLTSSQKQQDLLVEIEAPGLNIKINESTGDLKVFSKDNSYLSNFPSPYQSELTSLYARQILQENEVSLPDYGHSSAQHSIMLTAFIKHLSNYHKKDIEYCPIT